MNVWTYLKDRLSYVFIYLFSQVLIILVVFLALSQKNQKLEPANIEYMILLSLTVLVFFLAIDFLRQLPYYKELQRVQKRSGIEKALQVDSGVKEEQKVLQKLFSDQYSAYLRQLSDFEEERRRHLHFTNQWVHGMKTPVSVINLNVQQGKNIQTVEEAKDLFQSIDEENERMANGLSMILHTARLDNFEMDVSVVRLDLTELVREVVNEHKKTMIRQEIYPRLDGPSEPVYVEADRKWLAFVLHQLTTNAIKYTPKGEGKKILYTVKDHNSSVQLEVRDEGIGVPVQDLPRVFDPFFTGENGRRGPESTGMGLYLAKEVCDRLGQDISVDSIEGQGTIVRISFFNDSIYQDFLNR